MGDQGSSPVLPQTPCLTLPLCAVALMINEYLEDCEVLSYVGAGRMDCRPPQCRDSEGFTLVYH